jgi:hypothetical protein
VLRDVGHDHKQIICHLDGVACPHSFLGTRAGVTFFWVHQSIPRTRECCPPKYFRLVPLGAGPLHGRHRSGCSPGAACTVPVLSESMIVWLLVRPLSWGPCSSDGNCAAAAVVTGAVWVLAAANPVQASSACCVCTACEVSEAPWQLLSSSHQACRGQVHCTATSVEVLTAVAASGLLLLLLLLQGQLAETCIACSCNVPVPLPVHAAAYRRIPPATLLSSGAAARIWWHVRE